MNKGNKILLAILSFVLVCVMGYALFSDNINVGGSATATGNFEITSSCSPGISSFLTIPSAYESLIPKDNNYNGDTCGIYSGEMIFDVSLLMPSSARTFTIKMTNTGTIDAKLWLLEKGKSSREDDTTGLVKVIETGSEEVVADSFGIDGVIGEQVIAYEYANGNIIYEGDDNQIDFFYFDQEVMDMAIILEPGESVYLIAYVTWPTNRFDDYLDNGKERHLEIDYSTIYNWVQAN